jgi:hypothetical protein
MRAGRVNKARRGELVIALPVGYWRHPSGEAVLDPDEQVQSVVRLVVAKFAELGSVQGVVRFLVEHGIQLGVRARSGPDTGEIVWKRPARATITGMINSPIYAGVYVYGRRLTDRMGVRAAHGRAGSRRRPACRQGSAWPGSKTPCPPISRWLSTRPTWPDSRRTGRRATCPERSGSGRRCWPGCPGCGRCGRRMTVGYHVDAGRPRISYNCTGARSEWGGPHCQHLSGGCLDADVAGQVLQVLSVAAVEVHLQAVQQALADRAAVEKVWQQRLERAQQQADRARRCYRLAEPENRLVVRQLEKDWEQALAAQRDLHEQWRRFQRQAPQQLSARDQEAIRQAAADLPRLWEAPGVTHADRKEVVRAVVDEITVSIRGVSELVDVGLHWAGGRTTTGLVRRPIQYFEHLSYYPRLQQRVLQLAEAGWHPGKIADQLNRDGYQSARAAGPIRYRVVEQILRRNGRPSRTGATRCQSTRPKPLGTTSGCCPSSPPIWVAPPARYAAGSATDSSPGGRRPAPHTGGSCALRPRRSTNSATDWHEPEAAPPASTPASPKPSTVTSHRRSLLDRSRCPSARGSSRRGGRGWPGWR